MKNREKIIYTYKHRKVMLMLANKYIKNSDEIIKQIEDHDLDKLFMYLFYDKELVKEFHENNSNHHDNDRKKTYNDYIEMVLDFESARYTKNDKPLNAYDTILKYYPNLQNELLPILKIFNLAESNLPMDKDILKYAKSLDKLSFKEIKNDLINILLDKFK